MKKIDLFFIGTLVILVFFVSPALQQRFVLVTSPVLQVMHSGASALATPINIAREIGEVRQEFQETKEEVLHLRERIAELEVFRRENEILREQLNSPVHRYPHRNILATVIGHDPIAGEMTLFIDAGSRDGVQEGDPVVAPGGILIGRTVTVSPFSSLVKLLSHPDSRVDVRILPSDVRGALQPHGSFLSVDVLPQRFEFSSEESVVTTGSEGVYPPNLYLGRLGEVLSEEADVFERRRLDNSNVFEGLTEVFILADDAR